MNSLTAHELHQLLLNKKVSSVEITEAVFKQIEKNEDKVKAYVSLTKEKALKNAEEADKRIRSGENIPPLCGIPIAIKDNMCTKGTRTTCSSKILNNYLPPYDATIVKKLDDLLAVPTGNTYLY